MPSFHAIGSNRCPGLEKLPFVQIFCNYSEVVPTFAPPKFTQKSSKVPQTCIFSSLEILLFQILVTRLDFFLSTKKSFHESGLKGLRTSQNPEKSKKWFGTLGILGRPEIPKRCWYKISSLAREATIRVHPFFAATQISG